MTKIEAESAQENQSRVAGGEPGTEDYDEGYNTGDQLTIASTGRREAGAQ